MQRGITIEAQPGTAEGLKNLVAKAHAAIPKLKSETNMPSTVIIFSGISVNEVIPTKARETIFETVYLVSPA
jgi:hypothetical protein